MVTFVTTCQGHWAAATAVAVGRVLASGVDASAAVAAGIVRQVDPSVEVGMESVGLVARGRPQPAAVVLEGRLACSLQTVPRGVKCRP